MESNYQKLRIAYFAGSMQPGQDGVTRVLYKLIDYLNEKNIESIFFSPIIPDKDQQPVEMYQVPSITFPFYKDYKLAIPGKKFFEDKLKEFNPDIIHINSPCSLGYSAVKYGNNNGIPVVATYHTHFASYAKYYKVKAFENFSWNYFRKIYNSCQTVYVPSIPIIKELEAHGLSNLEFLPHGVDTNLFNTSFFSKEWKTKNNIGNKIALLFVGRLVWEKDLDTLRKAYEIISKVRNDIAFVLIGDGPIKSELKKDMENAIFLGYKSGKDLSEAYASSDVFVFPSTTETFGNVVLEAMSSGLPPICAKEGGAYGMISDKTNGLITNPRDSKDLAEKILFIVDQKEFRNKLGQNALSFARKQTWDKIFDKLFDSYYKTIFNQKILNTEKFKAA